MKNLQKSEMILWAIVIVVVVLLLAVYLYVASNSVQTSVVSSSQSVVTTYTPSSSNMTSTKSDAVPFSITSISTTSVHTGSFVTVYGSGFGSSSYVSWQSATLPNWGSQINIIPNSISPTSLIFTVPSKISQGNYVNPGNYTIQVVQEKGESVSNSLPITVTGPVS